MLAPILPSPIMPSCIFSPSAIIYLKLCKEIVQLGDSLLHRFRQCSQAGGHVFAEMHA